MPILRQQSLFDNLSSWGAGLPQIDELQRIYTEGRIAGVVERYGITKRRARRWCDMLGIAVSKKMIAYREDVFDVIDTEHKAYVLGLLVSDGCIVEGPKRYLVSLGSTDREIPEAFRSLVNWGRELYIIPADVPKKRLSTEYRISVGSKIMVERLMALGLRQRKSMREVPALSLDHPMAGHFVRGLFDGDGSVGIYRNGTTSSCSLVGSEAICTYFSLFLERRGLPFLKPRRRAGDLWVTSRSGNNMVRAIGEVLYRGAEHSLDRKRVIFDVLPSGRAWKTALYGRPGRAVDVVCDHCGRRFTRKAQNVRKSVFCGRKCWSDYCNARRVMVAVKERAANAP
jgi:hypothetical protein